MLYDIVWLELYGRVMVIQSMVACPLNRVGKSKECTTVTLPTLYISTKRQGPRALFTLVLMNVKPRPADFLVLNRSYRSPSK